MKSILKFLFVCAAAVLLIYFIVAHNTHKREPFTGFIVEREFVKRHMSNKTGSGMRYAFVYVPVSTPHPPPPPYMVSSRWTFFIANRTSTIQVSMDSASFYKFRCGQRVTMDFEKKTLLSK